MNRNPELEDLYKSIKELSKKTKFLESELDNLEQRKETMPTPDYIMAFEEVKREAEELVVQKELLGERINSLINK